MNGFKKTLVGMVAGALGFVAQGCEMEELQHLPVIADIDFGHTTPMITFPIGGSVKMNGEGKTTKIEIIRH